jgi:hypothetical protein
MSSQSTSPSDSSLTLAVARANFGAFVSSQVFALLR